MKKSARDNEHSERLVIKLIILTLLLLCIYSFYMLTKSG